MGLSNVHLIVRESIEKKMQFPVIQVELIVRSLNELCIVK